MAETLWSWARGGLRIAVLVVLGSVLAGCRAPDQPDLAWMYGLSTSSTTGAGATPVVLVPGLMGSRLMDAASGREVWPGSAWNLLTNDFDDLALPLPGQPVIRELRPGGLTDRVAGRDFYGSIVRALEHGAGYVRTEPDAPLPEARRLYYVFSYDWRRDLQQTAARLERFIEAVRRQHGDPSLRVDVVAHSMGGLLTRYLIRYGGDDVLNDNELTPTMAGAGLVRRVVLLGSPNLGSADAIRALIDGRKLGLRRINPETLATMPSMMQLFPHAITDWLVTADGRPLQRDQFDVEVWRRFQWALFDPQVEARLSRADGAEADQRRRLRAAVFMRDLERARRFVWSLTVPADPPVPLIVFGGDCRYTPARLLVEEVDGVSHLRLWPDQLRHPRAGVDYRRLMLEPGDGVVTKASLLARSSVDPTVPRHRYANFPLDYAFLLCARHDRLTGHPSFQDNLLDALLRPTP